MSDLRTDATVNVARFLPTMAARQPDHLALRIPRGRRPDGAIRYLDLTFAQLDRETDAWAHRLAAAGIARGTRVLLLVRPGLSLIGICFALFKIGAVPVVIDPGMGLRAFLRCVRHTRPAALVAIPQGIWIARLFRRTFSCAPIRVRVRAHEPLTLGPGAAIPRPFPVAPTRADELAAVLFTSGSTGPAKGVCYEHGMFEEQVRLVRDAYGIEPGEIDLPMLPVFALFDPALGMTAVIPEMDPSRPATVDAAGIAQAIRQCGVTNSFGSPVLWRKIVDHCIRTETTLPSIRRILSAGAPVPPSLMADFRAVAPHGTMHSPYGATETLPVSTISDREVLEFAAPLTLRGHGTCVGRPVPGVEVRIVALRDEPIDSIAEADPLPPGQIGEIIVRSGPTTLAYDQLPEATRGAKIADTPRAWHRMGDAGYLDDDGRLWFCGRKAERVETPTGVLFTDRCEPIFNQHPAVRRTALIGLGERGRQVPALVVEPRPGHWPDSAEKRVSLVRALRALGAEVETTRGITRFFFRRRFPVDVRHNAKIHRLTLARTFAGKPPIEVP